MSRGGKNMMKNKIMKSILNGGILAVIAALGITVYQIGTRPVQDPEEDYPEYARLTQESTVNDGGTEGISQNVDNTTSQSSMKTDKNDSTDPAVSGNSIAGKNKEAASGITKTDGTASVYGNSRYWKHRKCCRYHPAGICGRTYNTKSGFYGKFPDGMAGKRNCTGRL